MSYVVQHVKGLNYCLLFTHKRFRINILVVADEMTEFCWSLNSGPMLVWFVEVLCLNQYVQSLCKQSRTYLINELLWCNQEGNRWMHLIIDTDFHFQSVELEQNKSQTFKRDPPAHKCRWFKLISEFSLTGHFIGYSWAVKGWSPFVFRAVSVLQVLGHIDMITSHSCCISVSNLPFYHVPKVNFPVLGWLESRQWGLWDHLLLVPGDDCGWKYHLLLPSKSLKATFMPILMLVQASVGCLVHV